MLVYNLFYMGVAAYLVGIGANNYTFALLHKIAQFIIAEKVAVLKVVEPILQICDCGFIQAF